MGNLSKHTTTFSIIAAVMVMMGFYVLVTKPKAAHVFSIFSRNHTQNQVTAFKGRTIFKKWDSNSNTTTDKAGYVNDYRANTSYANGSNDPESNGPLVNSITYADKKKTKKAKTKKVATVVDAKSTSQRNNKLSASASSANSTTGGGGGGSAGPSKTNQKNKETEEDLNTVQYWAEPIFTNEDPQAVTKLIDSYQVQKVSSAVFYDVVNEMTHDDRPQLREFAVVSLRATPSVQSFAQLAWIKLNDTDADIRIAAEQEVGIYSDVTRLGYVISSLKGTSEDSQKVSIEAMKLLATASNNYGEVRTQSGENTSKTPALSAQQAASLQTKLTLAYNALGPLAQSSDAAVKSEAEKTMESISKAVAI